MSPPIAYDITRLVTRVLNVTPNGIDRVDHAFASHFVDPSAADRFGIIATSLKPRLFSVTAARAAIDGIAVHWGEASEPSRDPAYRKVCALLAGLPEEERPEPRAASQPAVPRIRQGRSGRLAGVVRWCIDHGGPFGDAPKKALPPNARYVNVSQFPLWISSYFDWLESRPDVKAVFFIHDLLPLEMPEYFRVSEYERHRRRLANLARFGAAAIVTTEVVAEALSRHLSALGREDLPILVAPVPVAPVFYSRAGPDAMLAGSRYFVICGTIEPRKNHLMLLHVWRELVRREGDQAPKLVIVGNRGWKFEPVVDLLERSPVLSRHVVEASGLSTPAVKRLLDGARALLMPSFAEGFGLPVREALAAGVPVVASDIPAFRAIAGDRLTLLSPIDGEAWLAAIRAASGDEAQHRGAAEPGAARRADWTSYFEKIDAFVSEL